MRFVDAPDIPGRICSPLDLGIPRAANSTPVDFDPALVAYYFNVFVGCIDLSNCEVVVVQGLGELWTVSALCVFHTVSHPSIMNPALRVLEVYNNAATKFSK